MKKIYEIKPYEYKHSLSVEDSIDKFGAQLKQFKAKQLADRPCIIIDNGSYECRAGWSFEDSPYLKFRNMVAKPKTQVNKAIDAMHLVGDELNEFDSGKIAKRSMFDKNIVYHY
jgi:actin-related protein 5